MAALSTNNLTLADWAKRVDPDGSTSMIAELLSQTNEILQDCVFRPSNLPTGERLAVRTGLPTTSLRAINEGIAPTKSTTVQIDEALSIFESRSETDKDLAMLNGNTASFRLSEDMAFLESMNQKLATTMFFGNPAVDPKEFTGLAPRYGSLSGGNSQNIIDALGTGVDNASIWLVVWGDRTVYCPFPKGSVAGLQRKDLGEQTVYNSDGTRFQALVSWFQWKAGLAIKDWRYVVRIANIDKSVLAALTTPQSPGTPFQNVMHRMMEATARIPQINAGRPVWYMNRAVYSALQRVGLEQSASAALVGQAGQQFGDAPSRMGTFQNIPIRLCDALGPNEARVVA